MGSMTAVYKYGVSENEDNNLICLFTGDKTRLKGLKVHQKIPSTDEEGLVRLVKL